MKPRGSRAEKQAMHIEHLMKAFPTPFPVKVFFLPGKEMPKDGDSTPCALLGVTYRKGKHIYIALNNSQPAHIVHWTLNHEWAHAMDWRPEAAEIQRSKAPNTLPPKARQLFVHDAYHDDHFYIDLGRVERAWEGWEI